MNKAKYLTILLLLLPVFVLAQDTGESTQGSDITPTPGSIEAVEAAPAQPRVSVTVTPKAITSKTPTPIPEETPSFSLTPTNLPSTSNNSTLIVVTLMIMAGIGIGAGFLKKNVNRKNQTGNTEEDRCGSIRELLEQKKQELEEMIKGWPEDKIKEVAQDKAVGLAKKHEGLGKGIDIAEDIKERYDKLNETIEMLQNKYDLCMLNLSLPGKLVIKEFELDYEGEVKEVIYRELRKLGRIKEGQVASFDSDLNRIADIYTNRSRFLIALLDDKVVGTAAIEEIDQDSAELKRMYVKSDLHGQGVAQKLFDMALKFAKEQNYKKLILITNQVMERAHGFYKKNEFIQIGEEDDKLTFELKL